MHNPSGTTERDRSTPTYLPQPHRAEAVYRGLTLAAMILLLASLWVF